MSTVTDEYTIDDDYTDDDDDDDYTDDDDDDDYTDDGDNEPIVGISGIELQLTLIVELALSTRWDFKTDFKMGRTYENDGGLKQG